MSGTCHQSLRRGSGQDDSCAAEAVIAPIIQGTTAAQLMTTVQLASDGSRFNRVACASTLCSVAGLNLADAKRVTDALSAGESQLVDMANEDEARRLCEFLEMHGARCVIGV
jgi:hypothetical protein